MDNLSEGNVIPDKQGQDMGLIHFNSIYLALTWKYEYKKKRSHLTVAENNTIFTDSCVFNLRQERLQMWPRLSLSVQTWRRFLQPNIAWHLSLVIRFLFQPKWNKAQFLGLEKCFVTLEILLLNQWLCCFLLLSSSFICFISSNRSLNKSFPVALVKLFSFKLLIRLVKTDWS